MPLNTPRKANQLRIIGGRFRGRKISFPEIESLRPTPDRIRETVFNWLAPVIQGATCLDLFAGSGALGFEAISRGAKQVVMCDQSVLVIKQLKKNAALFAVTHLEIIHATATECLSRLASHHQFDIVFLDPPFYKSWLEKIVPLLEAFHLLAPQALLYLEAEASLENLPLSEKWQVIRSKTAGEVGYHLAQYVRTTNSSEV